jgi:hypothetical protein
MAARVFKTGNNTLGLGRWTWMQLRGKSMSLQVVSIYRPCDSPGPMTVASQHSRMVLLDKGVDTNPRQVFLDDLVMEATEWKDKGDHLIIMGDFNDDVRTGEVKEMFDGLEMSEAIMVHNEGVELPATYK